MWNLNEIWKCIASVSYFVVCFIKTLAKYLWNAEYRKSIACLKVRPHLHANTDEAGRGGAYANIRFDCNTRQNVVVCRASEWFSLTYRLQVDSVGSFPLLGYTSTLLCIPRLGLPRARFCSKDAALCSDDSDAISVATLWKNSLHLNFFPLHLIKFPVMYHLKHCTICIFIKSSVYNHHQ